MIRTRPLACAVTLALAAVAASAHAAPPAQAKLFDSVVVFGDSLSDNGNLALALQLPGLMRFTTNPGQTGVEHVADAFGLPLTPALAGGGDFAFGGAGIVNNSPGTPATVPTLSAQLGMYLAATSNKADPHALYAVWGGANDIFYNAYLASQNLLTPAQVQANLLTAAGTELGMLGQLRNAGARYVMVVNLPNIGITPAARAQGAAAAAQLTGMAVTFNNALNGGLASTGLNIIPVNAFAFLNEVVANPSRYGFTNVTQPACSGGSGSSFECLPAGTPGATVTWAAGTDQTYLFADGVHPSTAASAMLGQYAVSIISAPGQMSLLAEAPLQVTAGMNRAIYRQAATRAAGTPAEGLRGWVDYSYSRQRLDAQINAPASRNNTGTLSFGADARPNEALTVGMAFSAGQQRSTWAGNAGGFKLQDLLASVYALWSGERAYLGAIGSFGQLGYQDVQRNIAIGPSVRSEGGTATGSHAAASLNGGWWLSTGDWRNGPYAELGWQRIDVSAYRENGNDSMAMTFGKQRRRALVGALGWQVAANLQAGASTWHPYAKVAWNHDARADVREVDAGLASMPGRFALPGFVPDNRWVSASLGVAAEFSPAFSAWVGYSGRRGDSSQRDDSLDLGIRFVF